MSEHKTPEDTLRDTNLKASIWRNESDKGAYYNTTFARSYKDEAGQYHDSQTFGQQDLLRLSELSRSAYNRINELKQEHAHTPEKSQSTEREAFQEQRRSQQPTQEHARPQGKEPSR
jgi:cupin superfamily acireductone dioxygenase involved in methionine salvage